MHGHPGTIYYYGCSSFYVPNFEKVKGAYSFCFIRPFVRHTLPCVQDILERICVRVLIFGRLTGAVEKIT